MLEVAITVGQARCLRLGVQSLSNFRGSVLFATSMFAAEVSSTTTYSRRQPETTVLYEVVRDHFASLLDEARDRSEHGFGYPRFVEREFEKFLACGLLCHGFVRVCCGERLVAFSCKTRGFCPSCTSRRMTGTAACSGGTFLARSRCPRTSFAAS